MKGGEYQKRALGSEEDEADSQRDELKKRRRLLPSGLLNFSNACFSNAAVQLLASAITPAQITRLVGEGTENLNLGEHLRNMQGKKLSKALQKVEKWFGDDPPAKLSPYLGHVLEDLHRDNGDVVDPVLFQQAFAFRSAEKGCMGFRGDTQQDASEYLRDLISSVSEEHCFVEKAFQYTMAEAIVCTAPSCSYRNDLPAVSGTLLEAKIPATPMETSSRKRRTAKEKLAHANLSALIEHQMRKEILEGATCEKCKAKDTLARQTEMTGYPDHLIVSINRAKCDQSAWRNDHLSRGSAQSATKDTTVVELSLGDIRLGEQGVYRIVAMVQHSGERAGDGHYSAYRKVEEGQWAHLDDDVVKLVQERNLEDGVKGFSSIVLLQRQRDHPATMLPKHTPGG